MPFPKTAEKLVDAVKWTDGYRVEQLIVPNHDETKVKKAP